MKQAADYAARAIGYAMLGYVAWYVGSRAVAARKSRR